MSEYGALLKRRSIRRFRQERVSDDVIRNMLTAGMAAPSAHNNQPWEFIVVRDKNTLTQMAGICKYWTPLLEADFAVVVVANLSGYRGEPKEFFIEDCAACTENILIAAVGEEIGGVWMGCYPAKEYMKGLSGTLGIPDEVIPFSVLGFGLPAEEKPAHSEYYESKVHLEKY